VTFDDRDEATASLFAEATLTGSEPVLQRLATRTAAVALDRWGRDLDRDAGAQEWGAYEQAVEDAAADAIAHYADEDADVDGVDAPVFEGRAIEEAALAEAALRVTRIVEDHAPHVDRNEPGGLVERSQRART
jgi:hypothetical protein